MKIGIIGAGYTGLAAGITLAAAGHRVTILEKEALPGGLAAGFQDESWSWPLERHYHHVFASDRVFLDYADTIKSEVSYHRPITSTLIDGRIEQLDSPLSLLRFSRMPVVDRLRTGLGLAGLKINPVWQIYENQTARRLIASSMGETSWKTLWEPLFAGKFGPLADQICASWFWARIHTRTPSLGYPDGGFTAFAKGLDKYFSALGGRTRYQTGIAKISQTGSAFRLVSQNGHTFEFDRVLCTLPNAYFLNLFSEFPADYVQNLKFQTGLGAVSLVLALKAGFMDRVYWLNINDRTMPYLAVVEHTNFISPDHYGGDHILYIGNYLPAGHRFFSFTDKQLLHLFLPHLKKINPGFNLTRVRKSWAWKTGFAQPVFYPGAGSRITPFKTPVSGLYLANIQQVYPWDRGVNYALDLGNRAAHTVLKSL